MSHAPDEAALDEAGAYLAAFEEVFRLHERGMSFSGRERNCAFLNLGGKGFADVSAGSGLDFPDDGRGLGIVDWDHDGDLDLWLANRTAPRLRFMRNDAGTPGSSLTVRLIGTESNRDAIGARAALVVAGADGAMRRLVRTVRAGEGFLSQASKWLHFGLGTGSTVERLTIDWPSGRREEVRDLAAGARLEIVEGSGRAVAAPRRALEPELSASRLAPPEPATPPRVVFVARAPMPPLPYSSFTGADRLAAGGEGSPLLVNLWATWCLPCVAELESLTARAGDVESAGLRVLALSVDGLDEAKLTTAEDAERFLAARRFPYEGGMASPALLDRLQVLHDRLFSTRLELAIPTSFLVDGGGRLAAVYRGPFELDRLLEDVRNLAAPLAARRRVALPFPGRWLGEPQALRLPTLARRFAEEGYPLDAAYYLELAAGEAPGDAGLRAALAGQLAAGGAHERAVGEYRRALASGPPTAALEHGLGWSLERLGRSEEALRRYAAALELDPGFLPTNLHLASLALGSGDLEAAAERLATALAAAPASAPALDMLAVVRLGQDRLDEAEELVRRALAAAPTSASAHNNLGLVLARRGRTADALAAFRRALELDPGLDDARANLEALSDRAERP